MASRITLRANGRDHITAHSLRSLLVLALAMSLAAAFSTAQAGKPDVKKRKTAMDTGMALFSDDGIVGYGLISDNYDNEGGYDHYCHGIDDFLVHQSNGIPQ